jgi:hypothetical protein
MTCLGFMSSGEWYLRKEARVSTSRDVDTPRHLALQREPYNTLSAFSVSTRFVSPNLALTHTLSSRIDDLIDLNDPFDIGSISLPFLSLLPVDIHQDGL